MNCAIQRETRIERTTRWIVLDARKSQNNLDRKLFFDFLNFFASFRLFLDAEAPFFQFFVGGGRFVFGFWSVLQRLIDGFVWLAAIVFFM